MKMPLTIKLEGKELWDENKQEFVNTQSKEITLEHSLVALAKWESKHHKYFIGNKDVTAPELIDYIKCMCITPVTDEDMMSLSEDNIKTISEYINDPMTAHKFYNRNSRVGSGVTTSDLIYYWMIASNIPVEFENWHINRLLTLIRLCSSKQEKPKKMSQAEIMRENARINAMRRSKLGSKG